MSLNQHDILTKISEKLTNTIQQLNRSTITLNQSLSINSSEFKTPEQISKWVKQINVLNKPILYILRIKDENERARLINHFRVWSIKNRLLLRGDQERINHSRFNDSNNEVIYVGSKIKNPRRRFIQHLGGTKGNKTYGLQLRKWASDIDYTLEIDIHIIETQSEDNRRSLIELLEQQIWEDLQPVFGKKSGL